VKPQSKAVQGLGAHAAHKKWTSEDGTIEFVSTELLYCDAQDLLADMVASMGQAAGAWFAGQGGSRQAMLAVRGEAAGMLAREVAGGKLTSYQTRLLASTTMFVRGDGAGRFELGSRDGLNKAFTGRKKYAFPAIKLATEVNFAGFLDGLAMIGIDLREAVMIEAEQPKPDPAEESSSEDSPLSMSATG